MKSSPSAKQPQLFKIENPLSARLGPEFFRTLPSTPGVYFFYDQDNALLYIGQSADLKARIGSYRHVTPEKNPKRTLRLVHRVRRIEWQECASAENALELERVLLLEHRPPFNRAGVWKGEPWWLNITVRSDALQLDLTRQEGGTGPHPPSFRYVFGSLVRCLYRIAWPQAPLQTYPHGIFDAAVPLLLSLSIPDAVAAADTLKRYVEGNSAFLLAQLEAMPLGDLPSEQEYWQEQRERLIKYAVKASKLVTQD